MQCVAVCCSVLQCVAVCCSCPHMSHTRRESHSSTMLPVRVTHCNTLQHTATHCNTLQHTTCCPYFLHTNAALTCYIWIWIRNVWLLLWITWHFTYSYVAWMLPSHVTYEFEFVMSCYSSEVSDISHIHMWHECCPHMLHMNSKFQCLVTLMKYLTFHKFIRDMSHVNFYIKNSNCSCLITRMNCLSVMSHMNESCHIWMSHVTYEWVMSHMNESCHIWMSHVTYEW